jgi:hypothetical protein
MNLMLLITVNSKQISFNIYRFLSWQQSIISIQKYSKIRFGKFWPFYFPSKINREKMYQLSFIREMSLWISKVGDTISSSQI